MKQLARITTLDLTEPEKMEMAGNLIFAGVEKSDAEVLCERIVEVTREREKLFREREEIVCQNNKLREQNRALKLCIMRFVSVDFGEFNIPENVQRQLAKVLKDNPEIQ